MTPLRLAHSVGSPIAVLWSEGRGRVRFSSRLEVPGACIGCSDSPCMQYSLAELQEQPVDGFLSDFASRVCPTDAITRDGSGVPTVDAEGCIGCGVCLRRCPTGAISMPPGEAAEINATANAAFTRSGGLDIAASRTLFRRVRSSGPVFSRGGLEAARENLRWPGRDGDARLLVRNLLISLGHRCSLARRGGIRVAALSREPEGRLNVIEFNWKNDPEHLRRLLFDDLPVVVERYQIEAAAIALETTRCLMIVRALPDREQTAMSQIARASKSWVPNTVVHVLTVEALACIAWSGRWLTGPADERKLDLEAPDQEGLIASLTVQDG